MTETKDSAQTHPPTPLYRIADQIEEQLARLRDKRPHLESRIDKAAGILVTHLSCPKQKVIRARVHNERVHFLVNGSKGTVYSVSSTDWSCTCPDHHRRGGICKHGIASFILWKIGRPAAKKRICVGCDTRLPRKELVEVQEEHKSLTHFPGDLLCASCADREGVAR